MSASRRKKIKRFVLDTNVWISYCINSELEWLAKYIIQNRLIVYASPLLISEIRKVFNYPKVKKLLSESPSFYINIILTLVLVKEDVEIIVQSPDPNDDFLINLAKEVNAKAIVCGDKELLNWKKSPVKLISKKEFERLY
jgi:putative PIN family toxin of toxin-antitoxin system